MDNNPQQSQDTTQNSPLLSQDQFRPGIIKERMLVVTDTIANGDMMYGDGTNNFQRLPAGTDGDVLSLTSGVPAWVAPAATPGVWTTWNPAYTGFSADPTNNNYYATVGKICTVIIADNGAGTSNATGFTFTLPIASAVITQICSVFALNNGTLSTSPGRVDLTASSTTATAYPAMNTGTWTAANGKNCYGTFSYRTV